MADLSGASFRPANAGSRAAHFVVGALLTALAIIGAIYFIGWALPYFEPGEVFWIDLLAGLLLGGLGLCLTLLTDRGR